MGRNLRLWEEFLFIDCLGCEFRGIVEKSTASQYNMRGEVVGGSVSIIMPVSVLGTLNIHGLLRN
jgi:hypothetical protein